MLYLGNNVSLANPVSFDENGKPVISEQEQKIIDEINLFAEKKSIVRKSIHYAGLCADLAHEENSNLISYLTGTVRGGMESLANFGVSDKNTGFLQDAVSGLVTNFEDAATRARRRAQERAERAQQAQIKSSKNYAAQTAEAYRETNNSMASYEVEETISKALDHIDSSDYGKEHEYRHEHKHENKHGNKDSDFSEFKELISDNKTKETTDAPKEAKASTDTVKKVDVPKADTKVSKPEKIDTKVKLDSVA